MSDLSQVRLAAAEAGDGTQRAIDLMIDGVAFPDDHDRRRYYVFSHEGDELGELNSNEVQYAIHYLKLRGRMVGTLPGTHPSHPGFSFAWVGLHPLYAKRY